MAVISQLSITTASVGAGVTLAPAAVAWVKSAIITKIRITPSIAASSFEFWIYEEAARTNIVYHAKAVTASPYYDPCQNDTDVITEVRRSAVATFENQDSLAQFIYSIKNNDSQAKTYTILIDYIALSTLASDIQDTITRLSTIVAGTWNATVIAPQYGGTGQSFQASSGVVTINSGTFVSNDVLTATRLLYAAASNTIAASAVLTFDGSKLIINQGANDDALLDFRSSDIAHGMTDLAPTDVYAAFQKIDPLAGGLQLAGFSEVSTGLLLAGRHTTDNAIKTTAGVGAINLVAQLKSGTTVSTPGADANLLVIRAHATTRFIFDQEGSAHADVEWIAFDDHDDVALLDALNHSFGSFLSAGREALQQAKIANFYDRENKRVMLNTTRLSMLLVGAVGQMARRIEGLERRLES